MAILYVVVFFGVAIETPWYAKKRFPKIGMSNNSEKRYEKSFSSPRNLEAYTLAPQFGHVQSPGFKPGLISIFLPAGGWKLDFHHPGKFLNIDIKESEHARGTSHRRGWLVPNHTQSINVCGKFIDYGLSNTSKPKCLLQSWCIHS